MQAYQYRGKFYTIKRNAYQEWICVELNRSTRLWRELKTLIQIHRNREIESLDTINAVVQTKSS